MTPRMHNAIKIAFEFYSHHLRYLAYDQVDTQNLASKTCVKITVTDYKWAWSGSCDCDPIF